MSQQARELLCSKLIFKDEHDGTANPTQRADLMDPAMTDSGLVAMMLDVIKEDYFFVEVTAVRRDHLTIDGPNGHNPGGCGLDGYFLKSRTHADWLDPTSPHFADGLEQAFASPWRRQIGLGGDTQTAENFTAIHDPAMIDTDSAFHDNSSDHIHFGSIHA